MKKTYLTPTIESITLCNALMQTAASIKLEKDSVFTVGDEASVFGKDLDKGDGFWE